MHTICNPNCMGDRAPVHAKKQKHVQISKLSNFLVHLLEGLEIAWQEGGLRHIQGMESLGRIWEWLNMETVPRRKALWPLGQLGAGDKSSAHISPGRSYVWERLQLSLGSMWVSVEESCLGPSYHQGIWEPPCRARRKEIRLHAECSWRSECTRKWVGTTASQRQTGLRSKKFWNFTEKGFKCSLLKHMRRWVHEFAWLQ